MVNKFFRSIIETSGESKTLTGSQSPEELLQWMNNNLTYLGENKKRLYLPEEVIDKKKGHCWEVADLTYHELGAMGYVCYLLYLEDEGFKQTHTTLIYYDGDKYFWFEWAWGKNKGIHGPFKTKEDVVRLVIAKFKKQYLTIERAKLGHGRIKPNMTEREYILMTNRWKNVLSL